MSTLNSLPSYAPVGLTPFNLEFWFVMALFVTFMASVTLQLFKRLPNENQRALLKHHATLLTALDTLADYFFVFLLAVIIRSFLFQIYRVPTGSLEPTISPGDFIAVSQSAYGLKLPVIHQPFGPRAHPKRGDIALFYWPINHDKILVKRVIGLPNDHIVFKHGQLTINHKPLSYQPIGQRISIDPRSQVMTYVEKLPSMNHRIYTNHMGSASLTLDIIVPKGQYFVMGDNRDFSNDSRFWGFVPQNNFIGKALGTLISWDHESSNFRWQRSFTSLYTN